MVYKSDLFVGYGESETSDFNLTSLLFLPLNGINLFNFPSECYINSYLYEDEIIIVLNNIQSLELNNILKRITFLTNFIDYQLDKEYIFVRLTNVVSNEEFIKILNSKYTTIDESLKRKIINSYYPFLDKYYQSISVCGIVKFILIKNEKVLEALTEYLKPQVTLEEATASFENEREFIESTGFFGRFQEAFR